MIILESDDIRVRRLELRDAHLLVKWLSNPAVLKYYEGRDRPHDLELVKKHFYDNREEVTQCILQYKSKDIGYLQFYLIDDEDVEKYGYTTINGRIFGMDQFIGETDCWNQGMGSLIIKETVG